MKFGVALSMLPKSFVVHKYSGVLDGIFYELLNVTNHYVVEKSKENH